MAEKAEVTPNALWPIATYGWVKIYGKSFGKLPIVAMRICPAKVTIQREHFPTGVVIFNENPMQNNAIPRELEARLSEQDEEEVVFPDTKEPYGVVALFKKSKSESV